MQEQPTSSIDPTVKNASGALTEGVRAWSASAKQFAGRHRVVFLCMGLAILCIGSWWATGSSDLSWTQINVKPLLVLLLVFPIISIFYGVVGLQIQAQTAGARIAFWPAFKTNVAAELAQALPLPGGAAVRTAALINAGAGAVVSAGVILLAAFMWIGLALAGAGLSVLMLGNSFGFLPVAMGGLICVLATFWVWQKVGWKTALSLLAHRVLGLGITTVRLMFAFAALGVLIGPLTSLVFCFAIIAGSSASIAPAGLGISETIAALLSTSTEVQAGIAFVAIALDRLVALLGFALIGSITMLSGTLKPEQSSIAVSKSG